MVTKAGLQSPVPQALYPTLAVLLLISGLASTAAFYVYGSTVSSSKRQLTRELFLAFIASLLLGLGSFFLLLWTGVYV